jgi:hypothetical protein
MSEFEKKVVRACPMNREFRAIDISDAVYPHLVKYDTEGRKFNRGCAVIARTLRLIRGIQEVEYGVFYAHPEFFTSVIK